MMPYNLRLQESNEGNKNNTLAKPGNQEQFEDIFNATLSKHAPFKSVIVKGNNKPHTMKQLRKEIMIRTRLKNKANRTKAEEDQKKYRKQRNLVVKLNKRAKRAYYNSLDPLKVGKGMHSGKPSSRCFQVRKPVERSYWLKMEKYYQTTNI